MNFRRSVITAELWRSELAKRGDFVSIFCVKKTTHCDKVFKILFRKFTRWHQLTSLCSNVIKFIRREMGEIVHYLPDQKISTASQTVGTVRIAPKTCQGQPPTMCSQCSRFHPNRFTFGGVTAKCVNTVFCPIEYFHDRLFETIVTRTHQEMR